MVIWLLRVVRPMGSRLGRAERSMMTTGAIGLFR
jgi:hypothetical protein